MRVGRLCRPRFPFERSNELINLLGAAFDALGRADSAFAAQAARFFQKVRAVLQRAPMNAGCGRPLAFGSHDSSPLRGRSLSSEPRAYACQASWSHLAAVRECVRVRRTFSNKAKTKACRCIAAAGRARERLLVAHQEYRRDGASLPGSNRAGEDSSCRDNGTGPSLWVCCR